MVIYVGVGLLTLLVIISYYVLKIWYSKISTRSCNCKERVLVLLVTVFVFFIGTIPVLVRNVCL